MLRRQLTLCILVVLVAAICGTIAGPASAGTYVVTSCRWSDTASLNFWHHDEAAGTSGGLPYFWDKINCTLTGDGVYRRFEANGVAAGATNEWTFNAPSGTWIDRIELHQYAVARSPGSIVGIWHRQDDGTAPNLAVAVGESGRTIEDATYSFSSIGAKTLGIRTMMGCQGGGPDCAGLWNGAYGAEYTLGGAVITLVDPSTPAFTAVSGAGWQTDPPDGVVPIDYAVSDSGSGISDVELRVDGIPYGTKATACEQGAPVPCPRETQGTFSIDTRLLSEGPHTVSLVARDAAKNQNAPQDQQLTITVRRAPQVSAAAPVTTSNPSWQGGGSPAVGDQLLGNSGQWTGDGISYAYQWMRCDPYGRDCVPISGATAVTYSPTSADVGHALVFCVTATNAGGTTTRCSAPTPAVVANHPTDTTGSGGTTSGATGSASLGSSLTGSIDRGQPNGSPASDKVILTALVNSRTRTQKVKFGKRSLITGRLVDAGGRPIAGARLAAQAQTAVPGAAIVNLARVVTRADGRFSYTASPGPSRLIRFGYRSYSADASFADTTDVRLLVAAGVTIKASPRKVRNRKATTFTGRVLGRPIPAKGVVVDLQVFFRKKWRTFAAPRTNRKGSYKFKYRFMAGAATWKFRARVRTDSSYPYTLGYSRKPVKVRVTGF